jgi:hypothetical protein
LDEQLAASKIKSVTPLGITVYSQVNPLITTLAAIDEEFLDFKKYISAKYGYTKKMLPKYYTVYLFPEESKHGEYNLSTFKLYFAKGSEYDESIYDQLPGEPGGYLFATELVLSQQNCEIAIAESFFIDDLKKSLRYGLEHVALYHNDREKYEATRSHAKGGGHPIL